MSDCQAQLPRLKTPTLILQCSNNPIAPLSVGRYRRQVMPHRMVKVIPRSIGHCPHLSAPGAITQAINDFLARQGLEAKAAAPSLADEPDDALDQAPCGLAQANAQGLLRRVNLPCCNWLGCAPGKLIGQRKL